MTCLDEPVVTWIAADGTELPFTPAHNITQLRGSLGLDAPPVQLSLAPRFALPGSSLTNSRNPHRPVVLPLFLEGDPVEDRLHLLASKLMQGLGQLRYSTFGAGGALVRNRTLRRVMYETGLEGDMSSDVAEQHVWRKRTLSLLALDPWWYGDDRTVVLRFGDDVTYDSSAVGYDDPTIGYDGSSTTALPIAGDAEAFPVVEITGPFSAGLRLQVDGQRRITVVNALGAGDVLTIDSRLETRGPRLNTGEVEWRLITPEVSPFTLPVGRQSITVAGTGFDSSSSIVLTWSERHLLP